jgi:hypothetical protein
MVFSSPQWRLVGVQVFEAEIGTCPPVKLVDQAEIVDRDRRAEEGYYS